MLGNVESYQSNYLTINSVFSGIAIKSINTTFITKNDVINNIERIQERQEVFENWKEANQSKEVITDGNIEYAFNELLNKTLSYLIYVSFSLNAEKIITLDRDRNIVELCYELYGSEDKLDFLINSNNLSGDEILLLPKGKEIKFY